MKAIFADSNGGTEIIERKTENYIALIQMFTEGNSEFNFYKNQQDYFHGTYSSHMYQIIYDEEKGVYNQELYIYFNKSN